MKRNNFLFKVGLTCSFITVISLTTLIAKNTKQDRKITINITLQEADLILKALGKLPLEESGNVYFNVQRQIQSQLTVQTENQPKSKDTTAKKKP